MPIYNKKPMSLRKGIGFCQQSEEHILLCSSFFYAFGFSQLSTKYETTKPPAMRVVSNKVIQNNHHSFYNEGVQAIKIRKEW